MKNISCIVALAIFLLSSFDVFAIGLNEPVPAFEAKSMLIDEKNKTTHHLFLPQ